MAAGLEPPSHVHVHGWLLIGGKKLSKTMAAEGGVKLTDIAPIELTNEYGVDPVRYYLLRETSLGNDGEFSLEGVTHRYNTDLANNLGNLVARVCTVVAAKCGGRGPSPESDSNLRTHAEEALEANVVGWQTFNPQSALEATWSLIGATNAYLEHHAPWKMEPGEALDAVMGDALEAIRLVAVLASPAMPGVCEEIWRRIGLAGTPTDRDFASARVWGQYRGEGLIEKGAPLFPRIKSEE
jgi:methionyl-tRNA synthetase